jgi:NAD(P)-dependent dehydrogenase (short-subunit alcohol dehydrogenase family)
MSSPRVAFVTGAGGGLGVPMVERLAADGFHVVAADIDLDAAQLAVAEVERATAIELDMADVVAVRTAIEQASSTGALTALVNNAAVFPAGPFLEVTVAEYDAAHAVNQRGYFFAAQAAAGHMIEQGGGAIVNIGSITEHGGWPNIVAYATAKGAAGAFTRALATELGPFGGAGQLRSTGRVSDRRRGHAARWL